MERARPYLGTLVSVRVGEAPQPRAALEAAFAAVARVEHLMSCHAAASELSKLNRLAFQVPVEVDPWTYAVFELAFRMHRESDGAFDCAVGSRHVEAGRLPPRSDRPLDPHVSSADIVLIPPHRIAYRRVLYADLGGIAKGFAVDRAIDALRASGARSGVVNAGGDLRAFGECAEPIHVRMPESREVIHIGELSEGAVATSATGTVPLELALVDPSSGAPPAGRVATVFAPGCALADALAKVVALRDRAAASLLRRFGAEGLLLDNRRRSAERIAPIGS